MGIDFSPLAEAVARMKRKTPVARALSSQEWSEVPRELRERAFWTANFASADLLHLMHDKLTTALELGREQVANGERYVSRSSFIGDMKEALASAGYIPMPGEEGTIKDHSSRGRLGLIYDINTQMAAGFAGWKAGQDQGVLDAFPAQELYRQASRKIPRKWHLRWAEHGGREYGGRMIALKNDPIWMAISAFQNPYPPFDYNSGMGIRNVARSEAIRLGVMTAQQTVHREGRGFNDGLSGNVERFSPDLLKELARDFGNTVRLRDGQLEYIGGAR